MNGPDLETEYELWGFKITSDGLMKLGGNWRVCSECRQGHVTHRGGGLWICAGCGYQY